MLLFLSLLALAAAAHEFPDCDASVYDPFNHVYHCVGDKRRAVPLNQHARAVVAPSTPPSASNSAGPVQGRIDTLTNGTTGTPWNGATIISPIGRSFNAPAYSAQTFRSYYRQNLQSLRFVFSTTSDAPFELQIETRIYEWDNVTNSPVGPMLWTTGAGVYAGIQRGQTALQYTTTATSVRLAEAPAPDTVVVTVPINAALKPDTNYVIIFFSPNTTNAGVGYIASRQGTVDEYPEGLYFSNTATSDVTPLTGWIAPFPSNDAAFTLTFSEIFECVGGWIANPFWNNVNNAGSPQNCLESTCADYPITPVRTPQAGFLDEAYQVTLTANLNGYLCNASYGTVSLPLTNIAQTSPVFQFYRLFNSCNQTVPCVNCGPNATSACYRTSPSTPTDACVAQRNVTWPNVALESFTQATAVTPATGNTGTPRAETRISLTPNQCPAPTFPNCPCQDCVTRWNDTSVCYAVKCDTTDGLLNQTAIVETPPSQEGDQSPQLFRSCDVQIPSVPAEGLNTRNITCVNATGQFPCPILPTE